MRTSSTRSAEHNAFDAGRAIEVHGWAIDSESTASRSCFRRGKDRLYVHLGEHWIELARPLRLPRPLAPNLIHLLTLATAEVYQVKVALGEGIEEPLLCYEAPLALVDEMEIDSALGAMDWLTDALTTRDDTERNATSDLFVRIVGRVPAKLEVQDVLPNTLFVAAFQALISEGWGYRGRLGPNEHRAHCKLGDAEYFLYFSVDSARTCFQVPLMGRSTNARSTSQRPDAMMSEALHRFLLELNDDMYWTKWGTDDRGDVLLCLDLPTAQLSVPSLRWVARAMSNSVGRFAQEIRVLADVHRDPHLAAELVPLLRRS